MNFNKKRIALLAAGILTLGAISAPLIAGGDRHCGDKQGAKWSKMHDAGFAGKDPDRMLNKMADKLDLSTEQRDQAFAKLDEYRPQLRETRFAIKDNFAAIHGLETSDENYTSRLNELANQQGELVADMIKLRKSMKADFVAILTEDQRAKFEKFKQRRGHHRDKHDPESKG